MSIPFQDTPPASGLEVRPPASETPSWVRDLPNRGVDAATAELRQRIQGASLFTRLVIALRLGG